MAMIPLVLLISLASCQKKPVLVNTNTGSSRPGTVTAFNYSDTSRLLTYEKVDSIALIHNLYITEGI
jgi:hypothetical protein